jgi:hypothetical protein
VETDKTSTMAPAGSGQVLVHPTALRPRRTYRRARFLRERRPFERGRRIGGYALVGLGYALAGLFVVVAVALFQVGELRVRLLATPLLLVAVVALLMWTLAHDGGPAGLIDVDPSNSEVTKDRSNPTLRSPVGRPGGSLAQRRATK